MTNLAGHDIPTLLEAFETAASDETPTCFIRYTIKGYGLPIAGRKDNHVGLLTAAQIEDFRRQANVREGFEL